MLPESLEFSVEDRGRPCAGALVSVTLVATRKNNFHSTWGPTDDSGRLTICRQDLIEEGEKDGELFLMDYGHPEQDFSGQIEVRVAQKEDIERALKAYAEFSPYTPFRPGYEAMLRDALATFASGRVVSPVVSGRAIGEIVTLIFPR